MMFTNFKVARLLCYMKAIVKEPNLVRKDNEESDINERLKIEREFNRKLDILRLFIKGYNLGRMKKKVGHLDQAE